MFFKFFFPNYRIAFLYYTLDSLRYNDYDSGSNETQSQKRYVNENNRRTEL